MQGKGIISQDSVQNTSVKSMGGRPMSDFMRVEDLIVYQRLCDLHLEVSELSKTWASDERYELGSQVRRSSNSAPAQLAEKHSDRHVRNKIEGTNRARGEALETVHHLFMAMRKKYLSKDSFEQYRERYHECVRMLNGLERKLEMQLDAGSRRFPPNPNPEP
jgi:four helix bundle protein